MEITFTTTDYYLAGILIVLFTIIILFVFRLIKIQRWKNEKLDHEYLLKIALGQFAEFAQHSNIKELKDFPEKIESALSSYQMEEEDIFDLTEQLKQLIREENELIVKDILLPSISKIIGNYPKPLMSRTAANISAKYRARYFNG